MDTPWHARKLLTIIAESSLERSLIAEVRAAGVSGYTIAEVRGGGAGGERAGDWEGERSIEFRVICDQALADRVADRVMRRYAANYALVLYLTDVGVRRAERFP
ncbi:MAG: transcriptional regulator [Burkholderiales bacterium]|nr:transcriptional regulator [Burkholderiales bacterium]